jgi:hypothetical protein
VSGSVTPDTAAWRHAWPWLLLALGLGAHFLLFRAFVQREVAWGYPRLWDQAGVLSSTYVLRHILREHGLAHGLGLSVPWLPPQGVALPFEAALLMLVAKPARWLALAVVWLHLAAWLACLVGTLRALSRGAWWPAGLGLGLALSVASLRDFGGLADFRFDLPAACAYGAWLCLALRAQALARPRGAALAGLMAGYLVTLRHIAVVYLVSTLVAFAALEGLAAWRGAAPARARLRGIVCCLGVLALSAGPLLAWRWPVLRAYYWWGHVEAGQAHAALLGIHDATTAWLYYPRSLLHDHVGPAFGLLALFSLSALALVRRRAQQGEPPLGGNPGDLAAGARLLACAVLTPIVALMADSAKSPIVAGVVMPALVLLLCMPALRVARGAPTAAALQSLRALGAGALFIGLLFQVTWLRGAGPLQPRAEVAAVTDLYLEAARLCLERGQMNPVLLLDDSSEYHVPTILTALAYERYGRLIVPLTPVGFPPQLAVEPKALRATLGDADLALLSRGRAGPAFPYSASLRPYRADLDAVVARHFAHVGTAPLATGALELWARPQARLLQPVVRPVPGWEWIERRHGLVVELPTRALRVRPVLSIQGRGQLHLLGGDLGLVRGSLRLSDGRAWSVPVRTQVDGERYALRVELSSDDLARLDAPETTGPVVQVRFDFARGFRPSEVGLGPDTRELVTASPTRVELLRGSATLGDNGPRGGWPELAPAGPFGACMPSATATATARPPAPASGAGARAATLLWQDEDGRVLVWLLRAGRCVARGLEPAPAPWQRLVGVLDSADDGRATLLFQERDTGQLAQATLDESHGLRLTAEPVTLPGLVTPVAWQPAGIGDVDGDGRREVVGTDATGALLAFSLGRARLTPGPRLDPARPGPGWHLTAVIDIDGDEHADLLFVNMVSGRLVVWLMGPGGRRRAGLGIEPALPPQGFRLVGAQSATTGRGAGLVFQREQESAPALELWRLDAAGRRIESVRLPLSESAGWRVAAWR